MRKHKFQTNTQFLDSDQTLLVGLMASMIEAEASKKRGKKQRRREDEAA